MRAPSRREVLSDHGDMRMVSGNGDETAQDRNLIAELDSDHPGFQDLDYRARRNQIARIAMNYWPGEPIPDAPYLPEEHEVWRQVWAALGPAHKKYASGIYLDSLHRMNLNRTRIPQLREISDRIHALSGFRLEPVAGLVAPRIFLENLAEGVFLCTQFIRHHSTPLYTPEPDVVHEVIGHAVTLASDPLAELNRLFGAAVKRTTSRQELEKLSRIYWFTIEFGVWLEDGKVKAYGTGLLSSAGELSAMSQADLKPLDFEAMSEQQYDPTQFQPVLFCAESFSSLYRELRAFLSRWPVRLVANPRKARLGQIQDFGPRAVLKSDVAFTTAAALDE
jgi:phenylalanine-4-hydroxylase